MQAFVIERYRSPQGLVLRDLPEPAVGPGDVLVRVGAAGVNQLDAKVRDGEFRQVLRYRMPLVMGNDLAGVVVRTGADVTGFAAGDRVFARAAVDRPGTFAELVSVRQEDLAPAPRSTGVVEAASLPLVALTAWQALVERAQVRPGQKVLVHAGSGGVGTVAIQLAKHLGATVATTAGAANREFLEGLGADVVVDYRTQDFTEVLSGYDVVLDSRGGPTLEGSMRVLRPGGTVVGLTGPPDEAFARQVGGGPVLRTATRLLSRHARRTAARLGVRYSFLFVRSDGAQLREVAALVDAGALRPVVERVFPFAQTPAALAHLERGRSRGKVVVELG